MKSRLRNSVVLTLALVMVVGVAQATEGRAWGDIHVRTMDGATYDFQPSGEFIASRSASGDLEVQLRLESRGFSPNVSVVTAVALQVDSTKASVALGREPDLWIDGRPEPLSGGFLELPDGGRIERAKKGYEVYWSDGSVLTLNVKKRHINAFLRPSGERRGTLSGLFGNFNGIAADDVEASLAKVGTESSTQLQAGLAELAATLLNDDAEPPALVEQQESLFEYEPGRSTYSYRRPVPAKDATPAGLSASRRRHAQETCEAAGVTDPDLLTACIVDVGYTRDESFAETAVAVQERDAANWDAELGEPTDSGR